MADYDEPPLPYGWIQEFDQRTDHPYYVDTKATPPRAIWVHPYEDDQFLSEHPDIREKMGHIDRNTDGQQLKPPVKGRPRRHSYSGEPSGKDRPQTATSFSEAPSVHSDKRRGFFGKMKDKAIGTKEEREAHKKQQAALEERQRQQRIQQLRQIQEMRAQYPQMEYPQQMGYGGGYPGAYGSSAAQYGPPVGYPQRSRFGGSGMGGGMALPLLGGMAGGLLLGDMLDGGFGGGGFGGGFDGGGFGGGGFDGGGGFF